MGIRERQSRERETVRRKILNAARTLFLNESYANVSMRKIAEQIEYSPGAIYSYFTSKEDIFFALAEEGLQVVRAHCSAASHANSPLERVREAFWRFYTFSKEQPEYFSLIFVDSAVPRISRDWERFSSMRELRQDIEQDIQQCIDEGVFPGVECAGRGVQAALDGGVRRRRIPPEPSSCTRGRQRRARARSPRRDDRRLASWHRSALLRRIRYARAAPSRRIARESGNRRRESSW